MSLITDKVFFNALKSNTSLVQLVGGRVYNTSIPVPDEELLNEPVPYIIITFDGMSNDGQTKDDTFEGDTDKVTVSIEVTAPDRETLGNLIGQIRTTVKSYFMDDSGHATEDYDLVPLGYDLTASPIQFDSLKPCYYQTLSYSCLTNP